MVAVFAAFLLGTGLLSLLIALITQGTVVWLRTRGKPLGPLVAISVLKPLKGADDALYDNLASFARQDYPAFELVFGCEDAADPALAVARRIARDFPQVPVRIVAGRHAIGLNPKVNNLRQIGDACRYDHWLISDSDIRVGPDYLRAISAEVADPRVGLVSNVIAGVGERTLGAALDNLHLNTFIARSVCGAEVLAGHPCVVGKSILFNARAFERLGGWATVKDVLAEDYALGQLFRNAGYRIALCPYVVSSVNRSKRVRDFAARHVRWGQMRRQVAGPLYWGEPLMLPSFWLGAALATSCTAAPGGLSHGVAVVAMAALLVHTLADAWSIRHLRGRSLDARDWILVAARDLVVVGVWLVAAFKTTATWRGNTFIIGPGSRLTPVGEEASSVGSGALAG